MLSVSNIAWDDGADPVFLEMISCAGFTGLDFAPTKIWQGWQLPDDYGGQFRKTLEGFGLSAIGMQSLFFDAGRLNLFTNERNEWNKFLAHIEKLACIANATGVTRLVFGAPGNRIPISTSVTQTWEIAGSRLYAVADFLFSRGLTLCLEPVPQQSGGQFLQTTDETISFLREVNHPGLMLNLDTAVLHCEAADIQRVVYACADLIGHVHVSEPQLMNFANPLVNHQTVANALKSIDYAGCVAIEMSAEKGREAINLSQALEYVKSAYG